MAVKVGCNSLVYVFDVCLESQEVFHALLGKAPRQKGRSQEPFHPDRQQVVVEQP